LWKAPDVVVQYLETGDEKIRASAYAAATWAAAYATYATRAARAARAATYAAAWAARAAAYDAAAWAAADDAEREKQNEKLTAMLWELEPK
jgi:hypothetical protein